MFKNNPILNNMIKSDKKILLFFFLLLTIIFAITIIINLYLKASSDILIGFLNAALILIFILTGILSFHYYRMSGIISTKKMFKWFAIIAAVSAPVFTVILFLDTLSTTNDPNLYLGSIVSYMTFIGLYIGMFLAVFLILVSFTFFSFGMIGILSALERGIIPEILHNVSRITPNISDSMKKKNNKIFLIYSILRWFFNIPYSLDTKTLTINTSKSKNHFPWSIYKKALIWQMILGIVVIIYISLNPFFLEDSSFQNLFNIATVIALFIPMIIIPWYIFLRLDAKIKGPIKDYQLYGGVAYRMYRTFMTLGTILIIIRLALKNVDPQDVINTLPVFFLFFIVVILIITYVYFNYFENNLAEDVSERFDKLRLNYDK